MGLDDVVRFFRGEANFTNNTGNKILRGKKKEEEKRLKPGNVLNAANSDARVIFLDGWGNQCTIFIAVQKSDERMLSSLSFVCALVMYNVPL